MCISETDDLVVDGHTFVNYLSRVAGPDLGFGSEGAFRRSGDDCLRWSTSFRTLATSARWANSLGPPSVTLLPSINKNRLRSLWPGGLQSRRLQPGSLQSAATNFGSGDPLTGLGGNNLGA